jgi:hypothetical protein
MDRQDLSHPLTKARLYIHGSGLNGCRPGGREGTNKYLLYIAAQFTVNTETHIGET